MHLVEEGNQLCRVICGQEQVLRYYTNGLCHFPSCKMAWDEIESHGSLCLPFSRWLYNRVQARCRICMYYPACMSYVLIYRL